MDAAAVIEQAREAGLQLRAEGDRLIVKGALTDELRTLLKEHKAAVLERLLAPEPEPWELWDAEHAGDVLYTVLWEAESAAYERSCEPTAEARETVAAIFDELEAAGDRRDMAAWTATCARLRRAMLDGLSLPVDRKVAARRWATLVADAKWNRRVAELASSGGAGR